MKQILTLLLFFIFSGCFVFGPRQVKAKILYKGKFSDNEKIRISYSNYRDNNLCRILLYNKGTLTEHFDLTNNPVGFIIDKHILMEKGTNSVFRMVSDTSNSQLRCFNFYFPAKHSTPETLATFVPLSEKERKMLSLFSKALAEKQTNFKFSNTEEKKLIGWVRIYFQY